MKYSIVAMTMFAALNSVQANAASYENLPEGQMGNGGVPSGSSETGDDNGFQGVFNALRASILGSDASDQSDLDTDPEAQVGNGATP